MGRKAVEHFDIEAVLTEVHKQDFGLRVSTNHAPGFLRIVYAFMRKRPDLKAHIYASKRSPRLFTLLKAPLDGVSATPEPSDAQAEG